MHISVLLEETIEALNVQENGIYVDATLGYGGHSSEILKRLKTGHLYAFDQDRMAIEASKLRLSAISSHFTIIKSNFKEMKIKLEKEGITEVDGIVFDLGVSSPQLDEDFRGFSYHKDAPLDMRMDLDQSFSAYDVVNSYSEEDLARIIFAYGEEKYAKSIAHHILIARAKKPIETTLELVEIIKESMPEKAKREKHPARKTFQAIRIEVNQELAILEDSIKDALSLLKVGGRCAVITFHSLEDKIVKKVFKEYSEIAEVVKGLPFIPEEYLPSYQLVNRKKTTATEEELKNNPRARSATLRVIERVK